MNTVQYWLERRPYTIAYLAPILGVPLRQMYRMVEGKAPYSLASAHAMASLLGQPFEALFEERSYRYGREKGWFPKVIADEAVPA